MAEAGREEWGSWRQFLFSVVGSLVGFGNIWRFPYICYRNGGGAFLIPFWICTCVLGFPIGMLETLYCQYSSLGPGKVWIVCPLLKGIWCCMMLTTFVVSTFYAMLMAWILYYLCVSFSPSLPWSSCDNSWNTPNCIAHGFTVNGTDSVNTVTNSTDYVSSQEEYWLHRVLERSESISQLGHLRWELILCLLMAWLVILLCIIKGVRSLGKWNCEYVICNRHRVLERSESISHLGHLRWELILCLLMAWLVILLCIIKGVRSMGKIAYVTTSLPYFLLTVLLIRGLLLPGSGEGIRYLFRPEWHRLMDYTVWRDAAIQLFYSAGYGIGVMSTLASYNKFNNNCYRDALLFPVLDSGTSVFASTVIFSFIGHMAHISGKPMDSVAQQGPGLVFIAYPSVLETLPLPQLWSVLFFLMMFSTGLNSQFCFIQALATAIQDAIPRLQSWRTHIIIGLCLLCFLLTIPMTTQAGIYILNLVDWYIASFSILALVIGEMIIFGWIYGTDRLYDDMEQMIGYRIPTLFGYSWKYSCPVILLTLWIMSIVGFQPIGAKYPGYEPWCDVLGLFIAFVPMLPVPVLAALTIYNTEGTLRERILRSIRPLPDWGGHCRDMRMEVCETANLGHKDAHRIAKL